VVGRGDDVDAERLAAGEDVGGAELARAELDEVLLDALADDEALGLLEAQHAVDDGGDAQAAPVDDAARGGVPLDALEHLGEREVAGRREHLVVERDAVVRGSRLELTGREHRHEIVLDGRIGAERRAHDVGGGVAPVVVPLVRAVDAEAGGDRLAVDLPAAAAGVANGVGGALAHDVDDVNGRVDAVGDDAGAVRGLGLDLLGAAHLVALGAGDAEGEHLLLALVQ
jgi:hypothetical protein